MKKSLIILFVLLVSLSAFAQQRTGNIMGKVTDTEGTALPGVTVTLTAPTTGAVTSITSDTGAFRFLSLPPGNEYTLTAELTGFKKNIKTGIIVAVGQNSEINLAMEMGKLEEEVTVTAVTPTVDAKKTSVGKNVTQEILQSLPTARDPWVIMQMTPAITVDRENVGGSESGQQTSYVAKGDASGGNNNVWALDGIVVTDPAAIGGSPGYWDFDAFEEMNISTGGSDVTIQTGGIALNMVTRRGGNKVTLGGRFYLTDNYFQANNLTADLQAQGLTNINKINSIRDYGFNVGGPIIKDKVWLWGSYGVQDIDTVSIYGTAVKPTLTNYNAKLNVQLIPSNRFEAFWTAGGKVFIGRSASASLPAGLDQSSPFHWGSPVVKLQDEQMFGDNLLLSLKFGYMNASFQMVPHTDNAMTKLATYDILGDAWTNSTSYYITTRPMYDYNGYLNYFNDSLFGVSHDIKLGVEYSTRRVTTDSSYPGDVLLEKHLNFSSFDPLALADPNTQYVYILNDYNLDWGVKQLALFFQDTITTGRFNFLLGIRYDRQSPTINSSNYYGIRDSNPAWSIFAPETIAGLKTFFKDITVPNITPDYHWDVFSPRIGVTYDLFGTGKTLLKLNFAMYGDFMGVGSACYLFNPLGTGGWMDFFWNDTNSNGKVDPNEVFWNDPNTYAAQPLLVGGQVDPNIISMNEGWNWGGFTPGGALGAPTYKVNPNAGSSKTTEYLATLEHEVLTDFSLALDFSYRHYNNFVQDVPYYPATDTFRTQADFIVAGQVPSSIPGVDMGTGGGRDYYLLKPGVAYTPYAYHTTDSTYTGYWGLDFVFNKRLSHNWMLDGSISYQDQWRHFDSDQYMDPTQLWALQDQLWAPAIGSASGKINSYVFSHWMAKLEGLYQLPLGFDVSFTFNIRQGYDVPHYITITNTTWPNSISRSSTAWLDVFGTTTLPTFYQLNLRFEKMLKIGDTGRIYLMADAFNVLNSAIIDRRYDMNEGTYSITSGKHTPYAHNFAIYQILNPFIARFGIRFQL